MPQETSIYRLAGALKALARILGMKEKNGRLLQSLGTDVLRAVNPTIWIDILQSQIEEEKPRVALIPDVRFQNEANWIAQNGGLLVRVERVNQDGTPYVSDDRDPNHASETDLVGLGYFDRFVTIKSGDMASFDREAKQLAYLIRDRLNRRAATPPPSLYVHEQAYSRLDELRGFYRG